MTNWLTNIVWLQYPDGLLTVLLGPLTYKHGLAAISRRFIDCSPWAFDLQTLFGCNIKTVYWLFSLGLCLTNIVWLQYIDGLFTVLFGPLTYKHCLAAISRRFIDCSPWAFDLQILFGCNIETVYWLFSLGLWLTNIVWLQYPDGLLTVLLGPLTYKHGLAAISRRFINCSPWVLDLQTLFGCNILTVHLLFFFEPLLTILSFSTVHTVPIFSNSNSKLKLIYWGILKSLKWQQAYIYAKCFTIKSTSKNVSA